VRLVSATHRDLLNLMQAGQFREDLYWRVHGAEVHLPPLRERGGDILLLSTLFLNQCAHLCADARPRTLSDGAAEALRSQPWPGNLRQLRHEMQRAAVLSGNRTQIELEDLSFTGDERPPPPGAGLNTLAQKVDALERREIAAALKEHAGNRSHAAAALGLSRQGLLKKMERYGLS